MVRLRVSNRENLTETVRQARGEYLYIPQHITRNTLEIRNRKWKLISEALIQIRQLERLIIFLEFLADIRREVNRMRARIFDEARNMEVSSTDLVKKLEVARRMMDYATPYIILFEHIRWLICIGM